MSMSIPVVLMALACGGGLLVIMALGAWFLINKSSSASPVNEARLESLDREYKSGELSEHEYNRRREKILNDRMS
ncbi:MAG: SHOCT domain-containing protein [Sphaerobacteraceae bacterium]|nr:MAG: SHOCT domain-containing protein [Sphaerobacteraceae bacterium]